MLTFSVAVDRLVPPVAGRGPKRVVTDWINISVFGQLVDHIGPQLGVGRNVSVTGRISVRRGQDARLYYGVVAEEVQVNSDRAAYTQVRFEGKLATVPQWESPALDEAQAARQLYVTVGNYDESRSEYKGREYPTSPVTWLKCVLGNEPEAQANPELRANQEVRVYGRLEVCRRPASGDQPSQQQFVIKCEKLEVVESLQLQPQPVPVPQAPEPEQEEAVVVAVAVAAEMFLQPVGDAVEETEEANERDATTPTVDDLEVLNDPKWQTQQYQQGQQPASFTQAPAPALDVDEEEREAYLAMLRVLSPLAHTLKELIWYLYEQRKSDGLDESTAWWVAQAMFIKRLADLKLLRAYQVREYCDILIAMSHQPNGLSLGAFHRGQLDRILQAV